MLILSLQLKDHLLHYIVTDSHLFMLKCYNLKVQVCVAIVSEGPAHVILVC